jgi:hypothetical protein
MTVVEGTVNVKLYVVTAEATALPIVTRLAPIAAACTSLGKYATTKTTAKNTLANCLVVCLIPLIMFFISFYPVFTYQKI